MTQSVRPKRLGWCRGKHHWTSCWARGLRGCGGDL